MKHSNLISKVRNALVQGINEQTLLPKAVIIVLDDDLITSGNHFTDGISQLIGNITNWLAVELHRVLLTHKENLPTKARKFKYPHILWIAAVHHVNFGEQKNLFRKKFNTCLHSVTGLYREMDILMLHTWDPKDFSSVGRDGNFTASGLTRYWRALDAAFQKWDRDQLNSKKQTQGNWQAQSAINMKLKKSGNDKYHWHKGKHSFPQTQKF